MTNFIVDTVWMPLYINISYIFTVVIKYKGKFSFQPFLQLYYCSSVLLYCISKIRKMKHFYTNSARRLLPTTAAQSIKINWGKLFVLHSPHLLDTTTFLF